MTKYDTYSKKGDVIVDVASVILDLCRVMLVFLVFWPETSSAA